MGGDLDSRWISLTFLAHTLVHAGICLSFRHPPGNVTFFKLSAAAIWLGIHAFCASNMFKASYEHLVESKILQRILN